MSEDVRGGEDVRAALRVLARFCWIDGTIDAEDRAALERIAGAGIDEAEREAILADRGDLDEAVEALAGRSARREVLRAARHIAHAHGSTHAEEAAIARMRDAWAIRKSVPDMTAYEGRPTDISELTRRFAHGEATVSEMVRKIRDDLGES